MRDDAGDRLDGGGGGQQMAGHALRRADRHVLDRGAEHGLQHAGLGLVADRSAGGVGVDVADRVRIDLGVGQRLAHGGDGGFEVRAGDDHVVRVAAGAAAGKLGVQRRTAAARGAGGLEHEQSAAFAHHEAVAIDIERPRCCLGIVVAARQARRLPKPARVTGVIAMSQAPARQTSTQPSRSQRRARARA